MPVSVRVHLQKKFDMTPSCQLTNKNSTVSFSSAYNSMMRPRPPPGSLVLGQADHDDGRMTRLGLPLCDNIQVSVTRAGASLRTPLLEDDRESCV